MNWKRSLVSAAMFCCFAVTTAQASAAVSFTDHGGYKLGAHTVHVIWWNAKPFSAAYQRQANSLFRDVAKDSGKRSNLYSVLQEYNIPYQVKWGGSASGSVPIPPKACPRRIKMLCAGRPQLDALLKAQIKLNHWPSGVNDFYQVMMPRGLTVCMPIAAGNQCSDDYWMGLHSATWDGEAGSIIWGIVSYSPYMNGISNSNAYDPGLAWILFHEHLEAITDPFGGSGWIAPGLREIADLCQGTPWKKQRIGMHVYTVPAVWSNRIKRCVHQG